MKIRIIIVLAAVVVVVAMIVEWKFAASMGAAQAKHGYNGICDGGVGEPYTDFIHQLRRMAESGDTNRLVTVLPIAEGSCPLRRGHIFIIHFQNNRILRIAARDLPHGNLPA
jgi:hypothetical protein